MQQLYPLARTSHGIHYKLLAPPDAERTRFTFIGRYQHREIVWDVTLLTLSRYRAEQLESVQPVMRSAFLEIGDVATQGRAICVALDIPRIDEPVILRTIIMIRSYKRLYSGRHEFGVPRSFPPHTAD